MLVLAEGFHIDFEIMLAEISGPFFINCSWLWIRTEKVHIYQKCHWMISLKSIELRYMMAWADRGRESPFLFYIVSFLLISAII